MYDTSHNYPTSTRSRTPLARTSRLLAVAAMAAGLTFAGASPAQAASAEVAKDGNGNLVIVAEDGVANRIVITESKDTYRITDGDREVRAGKGCTKTKDDTRCSTNGVNRIVVRLGDRNDTLDATAVETRVQANGGAGGDTLKGGSKNDDLNGGDGSDSLAGNAGADDLDGGSGADTLNGGSGNDSLNGGDGADTVTGGSGVDSLAGNDGADTLKAKDGTKDKEVNGGPGKDTCTTDRVDPKTSC
jgi:Ca2+-binding RTX toxin-like protein